MEEHLMALLKGLGYPVSWGSMGPGAQLPRIVVQTVSGSQNVVLEGAVDKETARIQVDSYGAAEFSALTVSRAVRGLLSGYAGGPVTFTRMIAKRTRSEKSGDDLVPCVSQDFEINYRL